MLRRIQSSPTPWWAWACVSLFLSGACTSWLVSDAGAMLPLGYALGTLYPALLFAGALRYRGWDVPRILLPAALLLGAARGVAELAGLPALAHGAAMLVEPPLALASAVAVARTQARETRTASQRGLPLAFGAVAFLELVSAAISFSDRPLPTWLVAVWLVSAPLLLALQLAAWGESSRRELERARRLLDRRVLRENERYRAISELSSDFSFCYRLLPDGRVRGEWITDAVRSITGYAPERFEAHGWFDVVHPDDRRRLMAQIASLFAGTSTLDSVETRIITRSGDLRWLNIRFRRVGTGEDGSARVVGAARDVTARVRSEQERRRLDLHMREGQRLESLGRLAGGVAHDFNNVLTVILGNANLALGELARGAVEPKRLERIRAAAEYAAGLTEQILIYSGKAAVVLEPIDLSRLVRDMADLLEASVSERARLATRLSADLPAVEGDRTQLRQLLLNLVTNASDAMGDQGGTIRISTGARRVDEAELEEAAGSPDRPAGHYVALEVSDTGPGLDPSVRSRVFDPFFTTKASGRGLGLAAALGIVRGHRGVIRVESEPGGGTRFEVLLPRSPREAQAPRPTHHVPRERASGSVLVVDDEEAVREVACEFLGRAGFEVQGAGSGEEAVRLAREREAEFDAVVLDLVMPGLSGEETFLALRQEYPELSVVLASGYDREQAAERFSARGVADFVRKPYEPAELVDSVRRALRKR